MMMATVAISGLNKSGALAGRNLKWEVQLIHHVVVSVVVSVVGVHNYQSSPL